MILTLTMNSNEQSFPIAVCDKFFLSWLVILLVSQSHLSPTKPEWCNTKYHHYNRNCYIIINLFWKYLLDVLSSKSAPSIVTAFTKKSLHEHQLNRLIYVQFFAWLESESKLFLASFCPIVIECILFRKFRVENGYFSGIFKIWYNLIWRGIVWLLLW